MKHNIKKSAIYLIIMVIFMLQIPNVYAQQTNIETVRVGYYEDGDYMSRNQQGEYVGYNIEYLQEIAKQSGYHFEIVDAQSWTAAYDMLVRGEVDVLPAVYYQEDRADDMFFSTQPMCSIYTTLNVRMDDQRYDFEDYQAFQGMKVGIIRDGIDGENFKKFSVEHDLSISIIDYDETSDLLAALDDGTLDGVAITHLGKNSTYRSVSQFSPSPLYFTVNKDRPDIMAEINKAMNTIQLGNPRYASDLYDKYLAPGINQIPVFTKEERQFIKEAKPIVVSYDPSFAPLSYIDKKNSSFQGVVKDIFAFIEDNSGLQFQYEAHNQEEALALLQLGKIDALAVYDGDYLWDSRYNMNSTLYYLRAPTSMLTLSATDVPEVLALPNGYQLSETLALGFDQYKIKYYETIEDCLNAVLHHEADATCMNTQAAGSYVSKASYKDMYTATLGQYINEISVGISSSYDPRLFSIINKCIQYLPPEYVDASLVAHAGNSKEVSTIEFMEQHSEEIIGIVCLILVVMTLLISYNLRNALRSNRRIQNLLNKDELTGLLNMNGFYRKWEENLNQIHNYSYALLYGDICQFKFINDNFGFHTGNQVLCASGAILLDLLDDEEYCGRLSSDHFAILMKYEDWEPLLSRLQKYMERLNEWRITNTEIPYKIEFMFGVYLIEQGATTDIHQTLDFANYARRYAKDKLGSFAILYDEKMREEARFAQELEAGLERAIQEDQFTIHYQPQVNMNDRRIIGSEALIRWNHPDRGFLMPGAFIPLFEKLGVIKEVDLWLFEHVCKTLDEWSKQGMPLLPVSCNFSRLHFQDDNFPNQVCEIADRWNIQHDLLELEITESAISEGTTNLEYMFKTLKEKGFRIAIDDFGSGYSSLGQLQRLTADVLKLDRSFVCDGVTGRREQIVVGSIIQMANELGMKVICEGIETLQQGETIQMIGCKVAQGYYYYRPMKREDYEALMKISM